VGPAFAGTVPRRDEFPLNGGAFEAIRPP
jgi:hypothetical protein